MITIHITINLIRLATKETRGMDFYQEFREMA